MASVIFLHVSWTTQERCPAITASTRSFLQRFLPAEAQRHRVEVVAMGMVSDHVHLVLRLPVVFDLPRLVQGLKGASARHLNADTEVCPMGLRWARGYDARSVSPGLVGRAVAYINHQDQRHPDLAIAQAP